MTSAETVTEYGLALFVCGCVLTRKNPTELSDGRAGAFHAFHISCNIAGEIIQRSLSNAGLDF